MQKQLVQVSNLDDFVCRAESRIYVNGSTMILTSGAKDELSRRKIAVVYGSCPAAATCTLHGQAAAGALFACVSGACQEGGAEAGFETLLFGLAAMLKKEYGVTDPEQLKALSLHAVNIIKSNI
ncbi:MAG: hypothetical protein FWG04_02035 [Desulfovibrionaceae bacterium]|nr:hypothetical protein [Desulfovibrionaceae bacterium]